MCRYSAFIPLYPLGILAGEMPLIWSGLPYIQQRKLHSLEMPNSLNFAFSYHIFVQVGRLAVTRLASPKCRAIGSMTAWSSSMAAMFLWLLHIVFLQHALHIHVAFMHCHATAESVLPLHETCVMASAGWIICAAASCFCAALYIHAQAAV